MEIKKQNKIQSAAYKTQHIKLKTEQQHPHQKR